MQVEINKLGLQKIQKRFFWLYENEIKTTFNEAKVVFLSYKNSILATAFYNPKSKITIRILDFKKIDFNKEYLKKTIKKAIVKRNSLKNITNSIRLIHSEADFLPGLIVDKYGNNLILMITTAVMEQFLDEIKEILIELLNPTGIYKKDDKVRLKEGLEVNSKIIYGEIEKDFIIIENGKKFITNLIESQKSGFFLDQRANRAKISKLNFKKVLDLFANAGGFGIYSGAEFIKFVEISKLACSLIEQNCKLNGIKNYEIEKNDVFKFLEKEKEIYDLIIIDPPAFAKTKSAKKGALRGWKYLIVNSLKLLKNNGYLALFSCSNAINSKDLLDLTLSSSIIENCYLEVVEFFKQDIDHPYILNMPNSLYLTGVLLKKVVI